MVKILNGFDLPNAANDDLVQRKSGVFVPRTMAQVKTDLALVKGDVGLGSVDNTSDAAKPISTLTQAALNTKVETVGGFGAIHVGPGGSLNLTVTADDANAGQSGFLSGSGYTKLESLALDNRVATTAPTINDDSADGYVVGSLWLNVTLDIAYVCLDSTVGAAVWKRMQVWDADLDTIAGLTATSDSFMQAKGSAWSSRTVAQVRSDLTIALNNVGATSNPLVTDDSIAGYGVGSVWLNTTADRAFICLDSTMAAAVWKPLGLTPTLRLDYGAVSDVVNGGTLTLTTWNNLGSAQAFTNGGASGSWLYIEVLLGAIGQAAALTQWAARLTFDTGASTYEFFTGLCFPSPNYGALNGHTFLVPNFLASGSRTVIAQIMPLSSNVLGYCRPTSNPNMEQLQIRVVEWVP